MYCNKLRQSKRKITCIHSCSGATKLKKDYIPVHFNIEPSEIRGFLRHTTMFLPEQLVTINEEQIIQTAGMIVSTDAIKKVDAMLVRQLQIGEYDG